MKSYKGLFSSASQHWATPKSLYESLNKEFQFDSDPTPLMSDGDFSLKNWGKRVYLNPPYGKDITTWLRLAYEHSKNGNLVVCLIPSRTDTKWWHEIIMNATDIRFLKGRLKFGDSRNSAPFPSAVVVFGSIPMEGL